MALNSALCKDNKLTLLQFLSFSESNQVLYIPQTVAHVFADILDNLDRHNNMDRHKNKNILLGTVQTISQDAFMSESLASEFGNFDDLVLGDFRIIRQHFRNDLATFI